MADLAQTLVTVRDRIARHERENIGEQDTKAALIVPVLRALGWDVEDLEDVKLEYRRRPPDNPVDYALFLLRTPRLFIEAKSLGSHLDDGKWAAQILAYATVAGVEWVALTDGNAWRIYNSHAAVPVEQKLFRVVHIADPDEHAEETLRLLSKAQLADHLIDDLWKSDFVDRQVRDALQQLFGPEPEGLDRIVFDGQAYDSLSSAGGVARKSVAGPFPGRDIPQTNGWTFWEYRGPDGGLHELDSFRRAVHDGKVISLATGRRAGA